MDFGGATSPGTTDAPEVEWANIKLRKRSAVESSKGTSNVDGTGNSNNELKKVVLRKPRSHSASDILDERPKDEATSELKKILMKQKAAAEKGSWFILITIMKCVYLSPSQRLLLVKKNRKRGGECERGKIGKTGRKKEKRKTRETGGKQNEREK